MAVYIELLYVEWLAALKCRATANRLVNIIDIVPYGTKVFNKSVRLMGRRLSGRFAEHLRSVRNNDVDKPVARHFNAANHSISDIKFWAISPISGGNDSRKRHEKRLIFKIGTIHHHGLNERFSFI